MADQSSVWAAFFNGHAPLYDGNCFTQNTPYEVQFLVRELGLKPGMSILDLGCGTGRHAVELARLGFRVTGVDLSAGMLAQARAKAAAAGVDATWIQEDATRFSAGESFDAAICLCEGAFGLLGAGDDALAQPAAILRNVAAALKPGAPCLFTVLNGYRMARRHRQEDVASGEFDPLSLTETTDCTTGDKAAMRERGFVPTELGLLFGAAGLTVDHIWGGTAGAWNKGPVQLDEMELMVVAHKPPAA
ncbi:MAG: methyltransferase domain-containing protein [Kiritimatiellae bacterium]|nr:methyltransferase domain-containing protein [Kiritimatiellia bacterium]